MRPFAKRNERMQAEEFNKLLGIHESYQMPERLIEILTSDDAENFYKEARGLLPDLEHDVLRDYFQAEHGDRDKMKQDYTPDCVCELVRRLSGNAEDVLDICAGTGALSIACGSGGYHRAEEVSMRAIPILLLNFGIRGYRGEVALRDVLTGETEKVYEMQPCGEFTRPVLRQENAPRKWKRIVSNPPYSLKWKEADKAANDPRFPFGITPPQYSDYLFVQDALSRLDDGGTLVEVLPHGVLFRGKKEEAIRKNLLDANLIDAIIGLPDNLFMNTGIPVLLMILKKGRKRDDVMMIDASKEFEKNGKVNIMTPEQIDRVCSVVSLRADVDKLAHVATLQEIQKNGYSLNIPRYVDTFEPEPVPDLLDTLAELKAINMEIDRTERNLISMATQLIGTTPEAQEIIDKANKYFEEYLNEKSERDHAATSSDNRKSEKRKDLSGRRNADRAVGNEGCRQLSFNFGRD